MGWLVWLSTVGMHRTGRVVRIVSQGCATTIIVPLQLAHLRREKVRQH